MKEKVQGALGVVIALVSMYLFSVLEVEGDPDWTIVWVGLAGVMTLGVAGLIELASIAFGRSFSTAGSSGSINEAINYRSERRLSSGKIADDMVIVGLV